MAKIKIPYYVVKRRRNGERKGYWQPTKAMIAQGAQMVSCGLDGPEAWALAGRAYTEWKAGKRKDPHPPRAARVKDGTIGAAFLEYRKTAEWTAKAPRTREDWERAWKRIGPAFGGVRPAHVTMAQLSEFRLEIEAHVSTREAHRCIKIWRALWRVMVALKYCSGEDPAQAVRNVEPQRRQAVWEFSEVRRLADRAWRESYYGLAAVIAVAWDTSLSPVDVRDLRPQDRQGDVFRIERAKTRPGGPRHARAPLGARPGGLPSETRRRDCGLGADLPQPLRRALFERYARRRLPRCPRHGLRAGRTAHHRRHAPFGRSRGAARRGVRPGDRQQARQCLRQQQNDQ
jgi:hypothetical protein